MSFALTESQLLDGSKTVTRRMGWANLQPGMRLCAVRKSQGLKKGEKVVRLAVIEVVNVQKEQLDTISASDVMREGFRSMTPDAFISMFAKAMGCERSAWVNRIEFKVIERLFDETA